MKKITDYADVATPMIVLRLAERKENLRECAIIKFRQPINVASLSPELIASYKVKHELDEETGLIMNEMYYSGGCAGITYVF